MGLVLSKKVKKVLESKVLESKVLEVVDSHLGTNEKDAVKCCCEEAIKFNTEVLKQARESIEKSDALLADFKAFILQMRHVESL